MAIARNDMFDFLIDIVPREEIQNKSKPSSLTNTAATRLSQVKCWREGRGIEGDVEERRRSKD